MSLLYVHALARAPARPSASGRSRPVRAGGRRLHPVRCGSILALVEPVEVPPIPSEEALRAEHALLTALARRFDPILPVRFGAALSPAELRRVVEARERRLAQALETVQGRAQMTVRFFGISAAPRRVRVPEARTGASYLRARRAAARPRLPAAAGRLRRAVKPIVSAERIESGHGGVQASIHHLVPRTAARRYRRLAAGALAGVVSRRVAVTGPWPPFAFTPDLWP